MQIERRRTRDETIHVRIDSVERQRAEAAAASAGVTLSDLVRAGLKAAAESVLDELAEATEG